MVYKSYMHTLSGARGNSIISGNDVREDFHPSTGYEPFYADNMYVGISHLVNSKTATTKANIRMDPSKNIKSEGHWGELEFYVAARDINKGEELLWNYGQDKQLLFWAPIERSYDANAQKITPLTVS